jgi:hypothetical protein
MSELDPKDVIADLFEEFPDQFLDPVGAAKQVLDRFAMLASRSWMQSLPPKSNACSTNWAPKSNASREPSAGRFRSPMNARWRQTSCGLRMSGCGLS